MAMSSSTLKIVTEPSVFVVGRQQIDETELTRFLAHVGAKGWMTDAPSAAERLVELGGRLCYDSFKRPRPGGNKAYIDHILESGHGSVTEHAVFTIIITGVSRSLTHELIRHRHLSPSQLSQRYVDESDCAFVLPPALYAYVPLMQSQADMPDQYRDAGPQKAGRILDSWIADIDHARDAYTRWVAFFDREMSDMADPTSRRKAAREAARSVLPNCVETRLVLTGNVRAWRNLIEQRGSHHADAEINRLAIKLLGVFQAEAPHLFGDYKVNVVDGRSEIVTPYPKV
jgi:thymidylate synthase (FAD)